MEWPKFLKKEKEVKSEEKEISTEELMELLQRDLKDIYFNQGPRDSEEDREIEKRLDEILKIAKEDPSVKSKLTEYVKDFYKYGDDGYDDHGETLYSEELINKIEAGLKKINKNKQNKS